jgi:hypothetical protein
LEGSGVGIRYHSSKERKPPAYIQHRVDIIEYLINQTKETIVGQSHQQVPISSSVTQSVIDTSADMEYGNDSFATEETLNIRSPSFQPKASNFKAPVSSTSISLARPKDCRPVNISYPIILPSYATLPAAAMSFAKRKTWDKTELIHALTKVQAMTQHWVEKLKETEECRPEVVESLSQSKAFVESVEILQQRCHQVESALQHHLIRSSK